MAARQAFHPLTSAIAATASTAYMLRGFGIGFSSGTNPPYSNIRPWVEKAAEQCIQQRQTVVMLVPEDMSVGWFSKALESVDEVRIITDGRINFIEPSTGLEKKGNSKGSMLLIWRPFISPRRMFTTVSKLSMLPIHCHLCSKWRHSNQ